ncbi:class I SAM-dependent methyltransferase [Aquabacterium sp.]|uniref:class I SAM-dependent methyltransferase n=1 Tax=Aquabacterium sp. TaxID=1872578 RepID=UPI003D6C979F
MPEADILHEMELPESTAAILSGYQRDAVALIARYEAVSPADKYRAVADLIPRWQCNVVDIGAGSGVDAAWLAAKGHRVLAIEPVEPLRRAGERLHPSDRIEWLNDILPSLARARAKARQFDLVLLSAVWQHLRDDLHEEALSNISRMLKPSARVIISVRNGPGDPSRPTFAVSVERTIAIAALLGLHTIRHARAESLQQRNRDAGVSWDWLAMEFTGNPRGDR